MREPVDRMTFEECRSVEEAEKAMGAMPAPTLADAAELMEVYRD